MRPPYTFSNICRPSGVAGLPSLCRLRIAHHHCAFTITPAGCCGGDPRRVPGLMSDNVCLQPGTLEPARDRLHACQPACVMAPLKPAGSARDTLAQACFSTFSILHPSRVTTAGIRCKRKAPTQPVVTLEGPLARLQGRLRLRRGALYRSYSLWRPYRSKPILVQTFSRFDSQPGLQSASE